jgi:SulP family sulfate permease
VAFKLIDVHHIREIFKSSRSESMVLVATFCGTLLFQIEFAIYTGVLLSLAIFITRTSHPRIESLVPDPTNPGRHMKENIGQDLPECPQLKIIHIDGSLFFCAVKHVSQIFEEIDKDAPRHLLIVGTGISYIDVSGAMVLVQEAERRRALHKEMFLCRLNREVYHFLQKGGYVLDIGEKHIFDSKQVAISEIVSRLDKPICHKCPNRIFSDCPSHGAHAN